METFLCSDSEKRVREERHKISNRWRSLLFFCTTLYIHHHDCMCFFCENNVCVLCTSPPSKRNKDFNFFVWCMRLVLSFVFMLLFLFLLLIQLELECCLFCVFVCAWKCLVYTLKLLQELYSCINCDPLMYSPNWMPPPKNSRIALTRSRHWINRKRVKKSLCSRSWKRHQLQFRGGRRRNGREMHRLRATFSRSRTPTGADMKTQSSLDVPKQVRGVCVLNSWRNRRFPE